MFSKRAMLFSRLLKRNTEEVDDVFLKQARHETGGAISSLIPEPGVEKILLLPGRHQGRGPFFAPWKSKSSPYIGTQETAILRHQTIYGHILARNVAQESCNQL
jgi:hypothetical protein